MWTQRCEERIQLSEKQFRGWGGCWRGMQTYLLGILLLVPPALQLQNAYQRGKQIVICCHHAYIVALVLPRKNSGCRGGKILPQIPLDFPDTCRRKHVHTYHVCTKVCPGGSSCPSWITGFVFSSFWNKSKMLTKLTREIQSCLSVCFACSCNPAQPWKAPGLAFSASRWVGTIPRHLGLLSG